MGGIGEYHYEGFPLAEKYRWFQSGPGAAAAIQVGDALRDIAAELDVSDGTIGHGLIERRLDSGWQGGAASAASGAFDRAGRAVAVLASSGDTGGGSARDFGDSFTATRNAIPAPPPPVGDNSWTGEIADSIGDTLNDTFGSDFGVQSDYRARLVANRESDRAANEALYRHEGAAREVLTRYQAAAGSTASTEPNTSSGTDHVQGEHTATGGAAPSAGAPGGADTATADTETAGWTPPRSGPTQAHAGPVPDPKGGDSPAGNMHPPGVSPSPPPPLDPTRRRPDRGYAGGYRAPSGAPLAARGGAGGVGSEPGPHGTQPGAAGPGRRGTAGQLGPPLAGLGGGGAARSRDHRNKYYIPDDEPFRVEYDFYVAPPVLGAVPPVPEEDTQ